MVIRTFLINMIIFINSVRWTEDHCIYRAKIESIQEGKSRKINEYGVRFIDFGMYFCNRVIQSVTLCIVARVHGIGHSPTFSKKNPRYLFSISTEFRENSILYVLDILKSASFPKWQFFFLR